MKVFRCDHCGQLVFFENHRCVGCGSRLAFLPDLMVVGSLDPAGDGLWQSPIPRAAGRAYRLCDNYTTHDTCNLAVPAADPNPLCVSCRLTRVIPDLGVPGHKEKWYKLEVAKRRMVYTLVGLQLPLRSKFTDPEHGLAFEFKADPPPDQSDGLPVLTGHAAGVITINVAEADDAERERRRIQLHEPYRTLLGHFRHEIGHYYWDRLVRDDAGRWPAFRELFGDERQDYGESLKRHYDDGPPADWQERFVTTYATAHPWEDWAETWAHYLHMADTLETAADCGLSIRPREQDKPALPRVPDPVGEDDTPFRKLIDSWFPLTYMLNNLNRGLGLPDGYPFVLSKPAVRKLRFVHDIVTAAR